MVSDLPIDPVSSDAPGVECDPPAIDLRRIRSAELLQGEREVLIEHGSETYRLRLTRNGKLILQK